MRSRTRSTAAVAALTVAAGAGLPVSSGTSLTLARRRHPKPRSAIGDVQPQVDRRSAFLSLERRHD
jgi:hypothetical protein